MVFDRPLRFVFLFAFVVATLASVTCHEDKNFLFKTPITDVIIIGASYADSCNAYLKNFNPSGDNAKYPFPTCPSPPTGRADGGRTWPEWIRIDQGQQESKGSPPGGKPIKKDQWNIVNLAQSGAVCDNAIFHRNVPDIGGQQNLYQTRYNTKPSTNSIYSPPESTLLINHVGINDATLINNGTGTIEEDIECFRSRLNAFHNLGFRRFLMIEVLNLANTPLYSKNPGSIGSIVKQINTKQANLFKQLKKEWNDESQIDIFPAFQLFQTMYDKPREYGFEIVNQACNRNCQNLSIYLWNDDLHTSDRAMHIFAKKVVRFINGVCGQELIKGAEGL